MVYNGLFLILIDGLIKIIELGAILKSINDTNEIMQIQVLDETVETQTSDETREIQLINELEEDIAKLINKTLEEDDSSKRKNYFIAKISLRSKIFLLKRKIAKRMKALKTTKIDKLSSNKALDLLNEEQTKLINNSFKNLLSEDDYKIFKMKEKLIQNALRVLEKNQNANSFVKQMHSIELIKQTNLFIIKKWILNLMMIKYVNSNANDQLLTDFLWGSEIDSIEDFVKSQLNFDQPTKEVQIIKQLSLLKQQEGKIVLEPADFAFLNMWYFVNYENWNDNFVFESLKEIITKTSFGTSENPNDASKTNSLNEKYQNVFQIKLKNK